MNNDNDNDNQEDKNRGPQTLEEALLVIVYHSGVFAFKISLIVFLWIAVSEALRKWLMP